MSYLPFSLWEKMAEGRMRDEQEKDVQPREKATRSVALCPSPQPSPKGRGSRRFGPHPDPSVLLVRP